MRVHWNHRVLAHKEWDDSFYYQIHEVHYEDGVPVSYTERGIPVGGDCLEDLNQVLDWMRDCLSKPILSVENFPNEHINE